MIVKLAATLRSFAAYAHSEGAALGALLAVTAGGLAFVAIADTIMAPDGERFDTSVLEALHPGPDTTDPIGPDWLDHAMLDLTSLGSVAVLATVALIIVGYLVFQKQRLQAASLLLALAGGLMLSETMKQVFERSRPPEAYRVAEVLNASFPSGHALLSAVFYLTIGAMLARAMKRRELKVYVIGVAIALTLIVGMTRVFLGVHWASDVLAGWCLGAAWATACWLMERTVVRMLRRAAPKEPDPESGSLIAPQGQE
ncbi:MAG: phosphatase PAP2 family protein [Alphaproteobacteria bacterium]|nr:phosphatase PAP2 family protein [Alphaproteobacteria bacterium]